MESTVSLHPGFIIYTYDIQAFRAQKTFGQVDDDGGRSTGEKSLLYPSTDR